MPGTDTYDYTKDAQFLSAPAEAQHDYLLSVDKDYAKASTADQQDYLKSIGGARRDTTKETLALVSPQGKKQDVKPPKSDTLQSLVDSSASLSRNEEADAQQRSNLASKYVAAGPEEALGGIKEAALGTTHGIKGLAHEVPEGLHRAVSGATVTAAPLLANALPIAAATAPLATAGMTAGGYGSGKLARYGAEKAHLPPDWQDVSEDAGNLVGGYAGAKGGALLDEALATPSLEKATDTYQRAVKPNKVTPEEQDNLRKDFQRAAPHIKEELGDEKVKAGAGGVKRASEVAGDAADRIWTEQVEPVREQFGAEKSSGKDVASQIRASVTGLDETKPGVVKATNTLADHFDKDMTVAEKFDEVKQLNNDKAVGRFHSMSPSEQTQAEIGDPALRGKVIALDALRESLFDDVERIGGDKLATQFRETRKDFGSLKSVQRTLYENTKIKSPQGMLSQLVKMITSPRETALEHINNPENLAPRSFNKLRGLDELQAPETLPARPVEQYAPAERGQLGLPSVKSPDATIRGPLFEQSSTPRTSLEYSDPELMKINMKIEEQRDILSDVNATAKEKAIAKTKLNSNLFSLEKLRGGKTSVPQNTRAIYEGAFSPLDTQSLRGARPAQTDFPAPEAKPLSEDVESDFLKRAKAAGVSDEKIDSFKEATKSMREALKDRLKKPFDKNPEKGALKVGKKKQEIKVFHGTSEKFDNFSNDLKGSITGSKSAKGAIWFTDDEHTAKAYSVYASETGPINKALAEADRLEKIAQRSGKNSDWDKAHAAAQKAEDLDTYDANAQRRKDNAQVKEATISGDFLEVDAKGKTPQELSEDGDIDSWLDAQLKRGKQMGKDGVMFKNLDDAVGLHNRPATHYAIFDAKNIKSKKGK